MNEKHELTNDEYEAFTNEFFFGKSPSKEDLDTFSHTSCNLVFEEYINEVMALKEISTNDEFVRLFALEKYKADVLFYQRKALMRQLAENNGVFELFSSQKMVMSGDERIEFLEEQIKNSDRSCAKYILDGLRIQSRAQAKKGAAVKLANDPKQAAKILVKECWDDWQRKPSNYTSKSAFGKDMMTKFESLDNQVVITRWCGQWEKETAKQHSTG